MYISLFHELSRSFLLNIDIMIISDIVSTSKSTKYTRLPKSEETISGFSLEGTCQH